MKRYKAYILILIDKDDPNSIWGYVNSYRHRYPSTFSTKWVTIHRVGVYSDEVLNMLRRVTTQEDILKHLTSLQQKCIKEFPHYTPVIARVGSTKCPVSLDWKDYYDTQCNKKTRQKQLNSLKFIPKKNFKR